MKENRKARTPAPRMPQSSGLTVLGSNLAGCPPGAPPDPPTGGGPHWPGGGGGGVSPGGGWKVMSLSSVNGPERFSAVLSGKVAPESAIRNDQAGRAAARRLGGVRAAGADPCAKRSRNDPAATT